MCLEIRDELSGFLLKILSLIKVDEGKTARFWRVDQGPHLDMILLLPHIAIGMGEVLMWVIGQVIDVVERIAPDADKIAARLSLLHLLPNTSFDPDFFVGCLSLVDDCGLHVWDNKLAQELFGVLGGDK